MIITNPVALSRDSCLAVTKGGQSHAFDQSQDSRARMSTATEEQCMQLDTILDDHTKLCHSLYESLALGSVTDEMENDATQMIERATHMALKVVKEAHIKDLDRVRQLLTRFKAHCETWDVVNDQDISPANAIYKLFKGDTLVIIKNFQIFLFEEVHGQEVETVVVESDENSSDEKEIISGDRLKELR